MFITFPDHLCRPQKREQNLLVRGLRKFPRGAHGRNGRFWVRIGSGLGGSTPDKCCLREKANKAGGQKPQSKEDDPFKTGKTEEKNDEEAFKD